MQRLKMLKPKGQKLRWFFRSFTVTLFLLFLSFLLLFGCAYCDAVIQQSTTGAPVSLISFRQDGIYFFNIHLSETVP